MDIAGVKKDTKKEIENRIKELESAGKFWEDVQPIDYNRMIPVTENYNFLPKNPFFLIWRAIVRTSVAIFAPPVMAITLGAKIKGRKNLKGIKGFVAVCNHVHSLDNMLVRQAVFGHSLYITVAEFNNMRGFLGSFIRAGGTLPFSSNVKAIINLQKAISKLLKKGCAVLGYPEQALWYRYEKPRPLNDGMFHIAVRNNVPVVPMFITFRNPGKFRRIFSNKKCLTLNILKPIYPDANLSKKENIEQIMKTCSLEWQNCYNENY